MNDETPMTQPIQDTSPTVDGEIVKIIEKIIYENASVSHFDNESEVDNAAYLAREIMAALAPPSSKAGEERGRCEICYWPLAESREKGCVPGDCSYRPDDPREQEIIKRRREALSRSEAPVADEKVIEQADTLDGRIAQTVVVDGIEFVRIVDDYEAAPSPALDPATVEALIERLKLVGVSLAFDLKDESAATVRDAIDAIRALAKEPDQSALLYFPYPAR